MLAGHICLLEVIGVDMYNALFFRLTLENSEEACEPRTSTSFFVPSRAERTNGIRTDFVSSAVSALQDM